jgi:putative tricarboxylic transport membrane protein
MDSFELLLSGLAIALQPENLLWAFIGCVLGTVVGVLPGLGSAGAIAILLPVTFTLEPIPAIIMLAAIFYGTNYGGTISSVLMNLPGEGSTVITCFDGYPMAKKGRGGAALAIAAIGSFVGGTIACIGLTFAALPLTSIAIKVGGPEYFALMVLGVSLLTGLSAGSMTKALLMGILGLLLATVGMDPTAGTPRFTFGYLELLEGINFVPVVMGLFGIGEILLNVEKMGAQVFHSKVGSLALTKQEVRDSVWPVIRGSGLGFGLGLIPGVTSSIASLLSYAAEVRLSKNPEKFGHGAIEGVAAPETANNSFCNANFVPLFTLGIPGTASIAMIMGGMMMNGLTPGPFLFRDHPDFVWAVIASMYVGNVVLLILNLPLVGLWVNLLKIPYPILAATILIFTIIGSYSINSSAFDVGVMIVFGFVGYAMKKLDFPIAPLVLTMILGPLMEKNLRKSLEMSDGSFSILWERPAAAAILAVAVLVMVVPVLWPLLKKARSNPGGQRA